MPLNFLSHSCYALEFFSHLDYPSVPLNFFFRTHPAVPLKKIFFCTYEYPAVPLFFYALTLLCHYFSAYLPCCAINFYTLILLCPYYYFSAHLPCCAIIFLRTYPAVPLFFLRSLPNFLGLPCCAIFFICPAVPIFLALVTRTLPCHFFAYTAVPKFLFLLLTVCHFFAYPAAYPAVPFHRKRKLLLRFCY